MTQNGIFRRRHLPHWDVPGQPFFVTACLDGSLSAAGLKRIRTYREELQSRSRPQELAEDEWEDRKHKLVFALVDELLDQQSAVTHLADERQAEIVQDAFLHFAGERYSLFAFVVMPSHHHWLFLPNDDWALKAVRSSPSNDQHQRTPREMISHSIQSYTATMCNRVRGESRTYWQTETFDHWGRDEAEMYRIIDYIEQNPVKAGFVTHPEQWRWSSARIRSLTGAKRGDPISRMR